MTCCNLLVIILEMILYNVVLQDIGLYSLMVAGCFTFGIKVTEVQFIGLYISVVSKNLSTSFVTSSPSMCQVFKKNS